LEPQGPLGRWAVRDQWVPLDLPGLRVCLVSMERRGLLEDQGLLDLRDPSAAQGQTVQLGPQEIMVP